MNTPTPTLLLVEDDRLTAEFMAEVLRAAGYAVVLARTLAEAVAAARTQPIRLAILDVELEASDGDGVAVADELTAHRAIPLIFVTGHTDADTLRRVKSVQPVAFLSKPFQPVDLTMQVALALAAVAEDTTPPLLPDCLLLPDNGQWINVRLAEVVVAEARRNFTSVFVFNRRNPYVVTNNLKNVARQLSLPSFYSLSRSHVVNLFYLAGMRDNHLLLRLSDEPGSAPKPYPIPADKRAALLQRLPLVKAR